MKRKLKDYTAKKAIIDKIIVYHGSELKNYPTGHFIRLPRKVWDRLRMSTYNESSFKAIIIRKELQKVVKSRR